MTDKLEGLTPDTRRAVEELLTRARAQGIDPVVTSGFRTCAEQAKIYASNQPGKITVSGARGCRSWHLWGRAVDILIRDPSDPKKFLPGGDPHYDELADIAKPMGFKWGGDFRWGRDAGHFEYHPGMSIGDLCPDSSDEACEAQITGHANENVEGIAPVDVQEEEQQVSIKWGDVVLTAVVSAVVFQAVGMVARKYIR